VLAEELRRRSRPPRLDGWTLLTSGEPPFEVNPADHDVALRAAQAARDGVGRVVIGPWGDKLAEVAGRPIRVIRCDRPGGTRVGNPTSIVSDGSLRELARQAEVSPSFISQIEIIGTSFENST
jgi:hypothetical protein